FAAASLAAFRVAGLPGRASARATAVLAATPVIAFPLVVSGNDVPVLGLVTLGLALAGTRSGRGTVAAGAVLGLAAAMKATAWPALAVAAALLASQAGWPAARRTVARFAAAAAAVFAAVLLPWLVTVPGALLRNTVLFPLGLTGTPSPAASPLPGHLLAAAGPAAHGGRGGAAAGRVAGAAVRAGPGQPVGLLLLPGGPGRLAVAARRAVAA